MLGMCIRWTVGPCKLKSESWISSIHAIWNLNSACLPFWNFNKGYSIWDLKGGGEGNGNKMWVGVCPKIEYVGVSEKIKKFGGGGRQIVPFRPPSQE